MNHVEPVDGFKARMATGPHIFHNFFGAMAHCQDSHGTHLFIGGWDTSPVQGNDRGLVNTPVLCYNAHEGEIQESSLKAPVKLCYASATCSVEGHIYYFGGSDIPYRGASVQKTVFVKRYASVESAVEEG